jgi:penicillin-binding protein 1A
MNDNKNSNKKKVVIFWIIGILPLILLGLFFYGIASGFFGFMPTFEELENPKSNLASEIYSSDGKLLGKFYYQNRSFTTYEQLSPNLVKALIATEDYRFNEHSGIDLKSLFRVVYGIVTGNHKGGGSTITQQLAKNLFPRDTTHYNSKVKKYANLALAKFKEWVTAVKLEKNYTKEEIIAMYLNTVFFGSSAYGIKSAARTYFNTSPDSLTLEQAALLVGMLKAPTYYSPVLNPDNALRRRNVVLKQMEKYKFITPEQYDSLKNLPITLHYQIQNHRRGVATYFREYLRQVLTAQKPDKKYYIDMQKFYEDSLAWETDPLYGWCNKNKKPDGTHYNIYKDGLKIYTTIDYRMQVYAENAVKKHLKDDLQKAFFREQKGRKKAPFAWNVSYKQIHRLMVASMHRSDRYRRLKKAGVPEDSIKKIFDTPVKMKVFSWDGPIDTVMSPWDSIRYHKFFLRAGLMSMESYSGYVKAYVGGIDYNFFQFDHVTQGKRQVGSTFKPFLYTLAMQSGLSPCYKVPNVPVSFELPDGKIWSPKNAERTKHDGKMVTLKWGLANSVNNISAWLMKQYSPEAVIKVARNLGIVSHIDPYPSICLGTPDISLYEMVGAFNTFNNKGIYVKPIFVTRIEDRNGNILATFRAPRHEAMSEETAYLMLELLKAVVNQGTSIRLRYKYGFKGEIAAKTGTTQNQSDGWFIGLVPKLTTGVWVGGEDRSIHFRGIRLGQGANMALPIWALYMKQVYADSTLPYSEKDRFERPAKINVITDCKLYEKLKQKEKANDIDF